jgi:hypothetical protein
MTQMTAEAVPVYSTLLVAMSYQAEAALLCLEFRDGALYCYRDVPHEIYEGLLTAPSKGVYFNRQIRGRFGYVLLRQSH